MTGPRRWPLFLIAAPAAVAVWSGWVGLGSMCGFGVIHPLPGIWDSLRLDTAITLPVGVEAYGAYALGAWLTPGGVPATARTFARRSAIGALVLGMAGQVLYHLLAAAHATRAPWPVVVLVSCLPVVTLGFGAALTHLLRAPAEVYGSTSEQDAAEVAQSAAPAAHIAYEGDGHVYGSSPADWNSHGIAAPAESDAAAALAASIAAGNPLSQRQVMARFALSRASERKVRQSVLADANGRPTP